MARDPSPSEAELAARLRACDEALVAGRPLPADLASGSLRDELACIRLLGRLRPPPPPAPRPADETIADRPVAPPAVERFLRAAADCGVAATADLAAARARLAAGPPLPDEPAVAGRLVADGVLTAFQAERLLAGDGARLLIGGRYRLLARLGAGGMGEVFLAEHAVMRHQTALKILPGPHDPVRVERFRREARAAASLEHPNVVRALESDRDGDLHYLVMEYVAGQNLQELVAAGGPQAPGVAAGYCRQAALGLQHAFERGVVHRDIKPSNLLLCDDGTVKILDLGLARFFHDDGEGLTGDGAAPQVLGTADYMAPEQAADSHDADIRADIYSLGCTLYFLLTGRAPYHDKTVVQKLFSHQFRKPEPLRSVRPDVPDGLAKVAERMTAKDPVDRFQTPAEAAAALAPWADAGPAAPPRRRPRRRRAALAGLALAGLALAGLALAGLALAGLALGGAALRPVAGPKLPARTAAAMAPLDEDAAFTAILSGLPPDEQLWAVAERLRRLNPGFDGKLGGMSYIGATGPVKSDPMIAGGRVRKIALTTDAVTDIRPLAALRGLESVILRGSRAGAGRLADLAPLRGLPLRELDASNNLVAGLWPLRGMPLECVILGRTHVNDLSPLRGMPLRELHTGWSPISDLAPLAGAPLAVLSVRGTQVTDLTPLAGAPLDSFLCTESRVRDLSPLAGAPIRVLHCDKTLVTDPSPAVGPALKELQFDYVPGRDDDLIARLGAGVRVNGRPAGQFRAPPAPMARPAGR